MFERFTDRARKAMKYAREQAVSLNADYIGTEHILLGLLRDHQGIAGQVLESLNVDLDSAKKELIKIVKPAPDVATVGELPFTPSSKRVLELSVEEARSFGDNHIGTEHILLGLLRVEDGVALQMLVNLGVNVDRIKDATIKYSSANDPAPVAPQGSHDADDDDESNHAPARKKASKTPALDNFGRDMTQLARDGKLDPCIGRSNEIARLIQILARRRKNNPVLLGEAGVGKTAIVEGFAQMIVSGIGAPDILLNKRVIELDLALMVAGTKFRGQFEERLKAVVNELARNKNIILFVDELHTLVGAGNAEGSIDASNLLKPALARGEVQCIGATTLSEYRKYIEKDSALERRFQPIIVNAPTAEETLEILRGLKKHYEKHHCVTFSEESMKEAIHLSERYITNRFLPDKAVDVLDEAGAKVRLSKTIKPPEMKELEEMVGKIEEIKERAVASEKYEMAHEFKERESKVKESLLKIKEALTGSSTEILGEVSAEAIREVVSIMTGVPLSAIATTDKEKLLQIESELHKKVISQNEAINAVACAIRRSRAGLKDPSRPIATMMFLGPTGVGKTMLAKTLAWYLFGTAEAMVRIDMSEYMEKHSVSKLIGAPPGYVGYEEAGQLTEKVRRRPYSVILLDEIEKAHEDVFNLFLQVLEDGRLTDGQGRVVDFRNTILIMTSNVGSASISQQSMGFGRRAEDENEALRRKYEEAIKQEFKPEFINRLDEVVIFDSLSKDDIYHIVGLEIEAVGKRAKEKNISLSLSEDAREFLFSKGFDKQYGARPMRRAVEKHVENPLSEQIIREFIVPGDDIELAMNDAKDKIEFRKIEKKPKRRVSKIEPEKTAEAIE